MEKGRNLQLQQLRDVAKSFEDARRQASSMDGITEKVNKLSVKSRQSYRNDSFQRQRNDNVVCFNCGLSGHFIIVLHEVNSAENARNLITLRAGVSLRQ